MTGENACKYRASSPLRPVPQSTTFAAHQVRLNALRARRLGRQPGALLRDRERQQRLADELAALTFPVFAPTSEDAEPTILDLSGLDALLLEPAPAPRERTWKLRYIDPALPYASQVRRRYAQRHAWLRRLQDALDRFWLNLLGWCLLIALGLFVASLVGS